MTSSIKLFIFLVVAFASCRIVDANVIKSAGRSKLAVATINTDKLDGARTFQDPGDVIPFNQRKTDAKEGGVTIIANSLQDKLSPGTLGSLCILGGLLAHLAFGSM